MRKRVLKGIACVVGAAVMAVSVAIISPAHVAKAEETVQENVSQSEQELREKVVRDYYEGGGAELASDSEDGIKTTSDGVYKYRVVSEEYKMAEIYEPVQGKLVLKMIDEDSVLEIPEVLDDEYTVVSLGDRAFQSIWNATKIMIPDTVIKIGNMCFFKCTGAEWIDIPTSVCMIEGNAFSYTPWLLKRREVRPDRLVIVNDILVDGRECIGDVVIPSNVTEIANWAFYSNISLNEKVDYLRGSNIISVEIPASVERIGAGAFQSNHLLKTVTIAEGVQSIGYQAFADCQALESITLPSSITDIGSGTFYRCKLLGSADFSNTQITSVAEDMFNECETLKEVKLPDAVTEICKGTFWKCHWLTEFTLPKSIKIIGKNVFGPYVDIVVDVPDEVTDTSGWTKPSVDHVSFRVKMGSPVEKYLKDNNIKYTTKKPEKPEKGVDFYDSKDKTLIYTVLSGSEAAVKCPENKSCTSITIPDTVMYNDTELKVTEVSAKAFLRCSKLTKVVVGNNVKKIGDSAFYGCGALTTVKFAAGLTTIGKKAFYGDSKLSSVSFAGRKLTKVGVDAFTGIKVNPSVAYPSGLASKYAGLTKIVSVTKGTVFKSTYKYTTTVKGKKVTKTAGTLYYIVTADDQVTVKEMVGSKPTAVVIPGTVSYKGKTFRVTAIADKAFMGCKQITSLRIKNDVQIVGDYSFMGCTELRSVVIDNATGKTGQIVAGKGLKKIGKGAFMNDKKLKKVVFGSEVMTTIGSNAFRNDGKLVQIDIYWKKMNNIGSKAFYGVSIKNLGWERTIPKRLRTKYKHMLNVASK